jgi:peptide/nickel transport system substrate-binding protein
MMRILKTSIGTTVLAMVGVLLLGFAVAQPQRGGHLRVALAASPPSLDQTFSTQESAFPITYLMYEGLIGYDAADQIHPVLAESYEANEDNTAFTFRLRRGVKFHDGTEMTAADVVASIERAAEISPAVNNWGPIASVVAVDDYTVRVELESANPQWLRGLAFGPGGAVIIPEEIAREHMGVELTTFVGTGPYMLDDWVDDQFYSLARFEDYVSPEGPGTYLAGPKNAYLDRITFTPVSDQAVRSLALMSGEFEIANTLSADDFEMLSEEEGIELIVVKPSDRTYLKLNPYIPPFDDPLVRRAAIAALIPEDIMAAMGPSDFARVNTTPRWFPEQAAWRAQSDLYYPRDPELARTLLEQSSYDGRELRFLTRQDVPLSFTTAVIVQQQLQDAGFNVTLLAVDGASFGTIRRDYSAYEIKTAGTNPVPFATAIGSHFINRNGERWPWVQPEALYWFDVLKATSDEAEIEYAMQQIHRLELESNAQPWLGDIHGLRGASTSVRDVPTQGIMVLWNTWLEQ